jgi:outer membrane protein assembly factor BamB
MRAGNSHSGVAMKILPLIFLLFILFGCSSNIRTFICESEAATPRNILSSSVSVIHLWTLTGVNIENFTDSTLLTNVRDALVLVDTACDSVVALDVFTGNEIWRTTGEHLEQARNMSIDWTRNVIYVSATRRITAVSLESGQIVWSNRDMVFDHNAHLVEIDANGALTVEAQGEWSINADTGELTYVGFINHTGTRAPSEIAWRKIESVANIIVANETIYALDKKANLRLIDPETSLVKGIIQFEAPSDGNKTALTGSWIAVVGDRVAIYFQDTDTLSLYQIELHTIEN